jgi:hypothetical protein
MTKAQKIPFQAICAALSGHLMFSGFTVQKNKVAALRRSQALSWPIADIFSKGFRHVARW